MKRILSPNAFIARYLTPVDTRDRSLKVRFQERYKKEIEELWYQFLEDVAVDRVAERYPGLNTRLGETPLSARAKNCLRAAGCVTVADAARYSPGELRLFRGTGAGTVKEISDYIISILAQ